MKRVTTASKMARAWRKIAANISERHKLVFGSLMGMRALVRPGQMATHWRRKNRDKREKGRSPRLKSQFWPNHFVARMNLSRLSAPKTCFDARETSFTARLQLWDFERSFDELHKFLHRNRILDEWLSYVRPVLNVRDWRGIPVEFQCWIRALSLLQFLFFVASFCFSSLDALSFQLSLLQLFHLTRRFHWALCLLFPTFSRWSFIYKQVPFWGLFESRAQLQLIWTAVRSSSVHFVAEQLTNSQMHTRMLKSLSSSSANEDLCFSDTFPLFPAIFVRICHFRSTLQIRESSEIRLGSATSFAFARFQTSRISGSTSAAMV